MPWLMFCSAASSTRWLKRRSCAALVDDRGDGVEVVAVAAFATRRIEQHARRRRAQHRGQFALHRGFDFMRHRAGLRRGGEQFGHAFARQEAAAGAAQRRRIEAARFTPRRRRAPDRDQRGRERADEQARAHRATEPAPSGQAEQRIGREPLRAERAVG